MAADDLDELRALIAPGRSVWERMVHLRKAWSQVRALTPRERRDLALKLGLERGTDVLERLVEQHPEHAPPKHVLRALAEIDPRATIDLARARPAQTATERLRTLESAADTVAERLLDPIIEERDVVVRAAPPAPAPAAAPAPAPAPVAIALPTVDVDARPRVIAAPAPASAAPAPVSEPLRHEPQAAASTNVSDATIAELAKLSLVRRLRALRYDLDGVLDTNDARRVLRAFPDGWARRRALLVLLEEGVRMDASLLSELSSRADRAWCERASRRAPAR